MMSHRVTVKPAAGRSGELRQCEKHSKKKKLLLEGIPGSILLHFSP